MIRKTLSKISNLDGIRADLVAFLLGAASALALPPIFGLPVLWLSVPGLLALIQGAGHASTAARRGWWFGFAHHLFGLYWITEAILVEAAKFWWLVPFAVPALAATLAVFIAVPVVLAWMAPPGLPRVLTLAGAWTLADIARQFALTGFPWNLWGSMWAIPGSLGNVMIQPAAWISVHGLTLLTIVVASLPALTGYTRMFSATVLIGWVVTGSIRLTASPPGPAVDAALIQGNIAQGQKWDRKFVSHTFSIYLNLTRRAALAMKASHPEYARVIVWPETASPFLLQQDSVARLAIARAAEGAIVLAGSVRFDQMGHPRNSLIVVLPNGAIGGIYDKWHLVPGGEYQPDWLPLGIQLVPGGGFAPGPGPLTLHVAGLPAIGPLICYESIFPGEIVNRSDRPAWLVNITNDAWFGNSAGPYQDLTTARMRAVEEGLPLIRAANTGISAVFDPYGREIKHIGLQHRGFLTATLPGALPPPFFARVGLLVPAGLAVACLMLGLGFATPRWRDAAKSMIFKNLTEQ